MMVFVAIRDMELIQCVVVPDYRLSQCFLTVCHSACLQCVAVSFTVCRGCSAGSRGSDFAFTAGSPSSRDSRLYPSF